MATNGTAGTAGEPAGAELRRLREAQGWSLAELARRAPFSKSYLSKLETGVKRITPDIARCLDEALDADGALAALVPAPESPVPAEEDREPIGAEVCPYPGLAAFGPDQARWFFGRDRLTAHLISQLDDRLAGGGLLAVVAPSGAGKSSLLAAGVIPALARGALPGSRTWPVVATTPGAHPLITLATGVAERTGADPAAAEAAGDPERFVAFLAEVAAASAGKQRDTANSAWIVLLVDQFEEIFTECRIEAERQAFIGALCAAAHQEVALVVLGVRADFYGSCLAYPGLLSALQTPVAVGPMSAEQLRAIITCPAQTEGLDLEPGLVELLLRDLGLPQDATPAGYDPSALPLLAHALRATWQQRDGQTLTVAGYQRTGGISQALATTAERAYTRLGAAQRRIVRQVLLRLINISDQGASADTRRRLPRTRLVEAVPLPGSASAVEAVLEVFGRARLLTLDTTSVEITHEALLRAWPRLRHWIDTDRAGNLIRQELDHAAAEWDLEGRDTAGLYRGNRLEAARTWASSHAQDGELSPIASVFLGASTQHERHAATLRRLVPVVLSVLVFLASGAAAIALHQSAAAQGERDNAVFNQITAQADRLRGTDASRAAQLDLTAYRMRPTSDLYTALVADANATLSTPLSGHTDSVFSVAFSPDGHTLASASGDHTVRLWNLTDPTHPTPLGPPLTGHTSTIYSVAFSPDGRTLASASGDQTVRLWNITHPTHPLPLGPPLSGHTSTVFSVAFSPDGHTLASASGDQTVRLWNITDPTHPTSLGSPLTGHTSTVYSVAFSPDGHTLASASRDQTVRLWDVATHHLLATLTGHTNWVYSVVFSPDGRILASGSIDQTVRLWNVTDPTYPTPLDSPLKGHTSAVVSLIFSPDGRTLASGSEDQTVRLWNVTDPAHPTPLGAPLTGHTNWVYSVAFSPDGRMVASGSGDRTVRLWSIPSARITGHTEAVNAVAFSRDGRTLATGSLDQTVRLWNVTDPAHPTPLGAPLTGHTNWVYSVALSPDGRMVASGSGDRTVRLWNVSDPTRPTPLGPPLVGHTDIIESVAFSLDGRTLASGGFDRTVRLWNVRDPTRPTLLGAPLTSYTDTVISVAFSPDGRTLATSSSDHTVRLWNVTNPARPTPLGPPLSGHTGRVHTVAFSPDGHTLASGSVDQTVRLWNLTDLSHLSSLGPPLSGHIGSIFSVAFSPDGRTLASGGSDRTVRLWNVSDPAHPTPLGSPLSGHTHWVNAVAFSPDGRTLATGSADQTVRLWGMNVDQAIQRICTVTINTLTPATWAQYVSPGLPYHPPCP
ncbi:MAG: helix-turn-helix domain-containing protein [Pseudonocardiales bacterium]|nr:helix-turn-helix domain-containing protein [Pseudonocardiales bacterium]